MSEVVDGGHVRLLEDRIDELQKDKDRLIDLVEKLEGVRQPVREEHATKVSLKCRLGAHRWHSLPPYNERECLRCGRIDIAELDYRGRPHNWRTLAHHTPGRS